MSEWNKAALALAWIPVSKRLPTLEDADENGYVLTYDSRGVQETFEGEEIEYWNRTHDIKITHWMILPEKPESDGDEQ